MSDFVGFCSQGRGFWDEGTHHFKMYTGQAGVTADISVGAREECGHGSGGPCIILGITTITPHQNGDYSGPVLLRGVVSGYHSQDHEGTLQSRFGDFIPLSNHRSVNDLLATDGTQLCAKRAYIDSDLWYHIINQTADGQEAIDKLRREEAEFDELTELKALPRFFKKFMIWSAKYLICK